MGPLTPSILRLSHCLPGAGNGTRTRDPQLGRLMLYQLSYSRPRTPSVSRLTPAGGEGRIRTFEGISRQIYSLLPLATREPLHAPHTLVRRSGDTSSTPRESRFPWSWRRDLNPRPAVYKTAALPLSYASNFDKRQMLSAGSRPFKTRRRVFRLFRVRTLAHDLVEEDPDCH